MNKRGLHIIITTILLILLAIAGVVIIWAAVKSIITDTNDFDSDVFSSEIDVRNIQIDNKNKKVGFMVISKSSKDNIKGIQILLQDRDGNVCGKRKPGDIKSLASQSFD